MSGTLLLLAASLTPLACGSAPGDSPFRPPAVPLVTIDPYTSCWSMADRLAADWPRHWTGRVHAMCGFVRVDGKPFRFMGSAPEVRDEAAQTSLEVRATQTVYRFAAGGASLAVTFTSPLLVADLDLASRPAAYITFEAASADGKPHAVQIYFDATAEWCVNEPKQQVAWRRVDAGGLEAMRVGTVEQRVLATKGDNVRIDWGYLYVAVPKGSAACVIASDKKARGAFAAGGPLSTEDDRRMPRAANDEWPVLAAALDLGTVDRTPGLRHVIIAYDDLYSVEYFGQKLRPWWRRDGSATAESMLADAERQYADVLRRCDAFDKQLDEAARASDGAEYAALCRLVYRQAVAAH
jgi:hypothetical protein